MGITRTRVIWAGIAAAVVAGLAAPPAAAVGPRVPVDPLELWRDTRGREKDAPLSDFRLISYFFTRGSVTNQVADPSGLRGVSLGPIGAFAGSTTTVGQSGTAYYMESRWIPVIEYSPFFADGLATFRAQFEIDFLWGKSANAVQNNEGGGFNADQVNLQTKNLNVAIYPTRNPRQLSILVGTHAVYDNVYDPTRTSVFDLVRTGYKLAYLGSDATGISTYFSWKGHGKVSVLLLDAGQPERSLTGDPRLKFAWITMADYNYELAPGTYVGASLWYLRDDTKGAAFAFEGLVRAGPASTGLGSFTGTSRFSIDQPSGYVTWAGVNFQHNLDFRGGPFAASGFAMLNAGRYTSNKPDTQLNPSVDVLGLGLNLEVIYNWGRTSNDVISFEAMFTTGDSNPQDDKYTGAFTLNMYGLPGAVWFNHKMLILFPFIQTVSNYTGAVTDISNQGYGLTAVTAAFSHDLIPHKLKLKVGAGAAMANADPVAQTPGIEPGRFIGAEVNAELTWQIRYLLNIGAHAALMYKGSFYDGNPRVTTSPWAFFTTFTWYAF